MKFWIGLLSLFVFSMFILAGCTVTIPTNGVVVCNKPYILVGASCCLDSNDNNICDKDEVQKPVDETPVVPTDGVKEVKTEFNLTRGESVSVGGKTFTLVDFSIFENKLETEVDVDGVERLIYETKKPEIVNGLRITPLTVDRLMVNLVIKIEPFKLNPDEYLLEVDSGEALLGKVIRLVNVQDDKGVLLEIVDTERTVFIPSGETRQVDGLKITNVESFYRTARTQRYAILRIVSA